LDWINRLMKSLRLGPPNVSPAARKMGRASVELKMEFVGMAAPTPRGRKTGKLSGPDRHKEKPRQL
jgi:hypothetical protein